MADLPWGEIAAGFLAFGAAIISLFTGRRQGKREAVTAQAKDVQKKSDAAAVDLHRKIVDQHAAGIDFKNEGLIIDLANSCRGLRMVALWMAEHCRLTYGRRVVCTRVLERVDGSSGVHEAGRGVDFRNEYGGSLQFSKKEAAAICEAVNRKFPRRDGKLVAIHHSFEDGPRHFHLQIPIEWRDAITL